MSQSSLDTRESKVEFTSSSQVPILTFANVDARTGSSRFTSHNSRTENCLQSVVPNISMRLTAGSCAGSPSRSTCLPPHGRFLQTCSRLLPLCAARKNRALRTHQLHVCLAEQGGLCGATLQCGVAFNVKRKKWWMVWPPMRWAATLLGASLATTSPRDNISAFRRKDFPVPAGPTMLISTQRPFAESL